MTDRPPIPDLVLTSKVIAIGRNVPAAKAAHVGEAFVAGGVHVMELTLNEPQDAALRAIAALAAVADDLGALVGAGTVLSIGAAKRAADAGARFIVSPHTDPELIAWCALSGVPCYPGALSPSACAMPPRRSRSCARRPSRSFRCRVTPTCNVRSR